MKRIEATCTWGDGPDVLLVIGDNPKDWADLTAEEAKNLAWQLLNAASHADELELFAAQCEEQNG